ncbi:MAG: ABC transporter permease subunit [bacterium]
MLTIFKKTLYTNRIFVLVISLITLLFILMYVGLYPSVKEQADQFSKLLESYPKSMLEIFGIENQLSFTVLENFVTIELFSFLWPILVVVLGTSLGMKLFAGEIDKGTMEILLALPLSRARIFLGKYCAGIVILVIYTGTSIYGIPFIAWLFKIDFMLANYAYLFASSLLFALAIYSLAIMFSTMFSESSKGIMLTVGIVLMMYVLNVLSTLKASLENLQYLSFFHYYNASAALSSKELPWETILVFGLVIIIAGVLAGVIFQRRDIAL